MLVNTREIANRLGYHVDMQKAQTEFLARLGVDLKRRGQNKDDLAVPKKRGKVKYALS